MISNTVGNYYRTRVKFGLDDLFDPFVKLFEKVTHLQLIFALRRSAYVKSRRRGPIENQGINESQSFPCTMHERDITT
jgi:hypothetical protein